MYLYNPQLWKDKLMLCQKLPLCKWAPSSVHYGVLLQDYGQFLVTLSTFFLTNIIQKCFDSEGQCFTNLRKFVVDNYYIVYFTSHIQAISVISRHLSLSSTIFQRKLNLHTNKFPAQKSSHNLFKMSLPYFCKSKFYQLS